MLRALGITFAVYWIAGVAITWALVDEREAVRLRADQLAPARVQKMPLWKRRAFCFASCVTLWPFLLWNFLASQ